MTHNGEVVPNLIIEKVTAAGGGFADGAWWADTATSGGVRFTGAAVVWIEEAANGEH